MPSPAPLTVQPIHFTSDYAIWREFYLKLGLHPTTANDPMVTILAADSGQLMLAEVPADHRLDGVRLVEFTVPDVDAHAEALEKAGTAAPRVQLAHRDQSNIALDLPQGRVHIGQHLTTAGATLFDPAGLNIGALLYCPTEMVAAGAQQLAPYGLSPRIASDNGGWTDLTGNGVLAFHDSELHTVSNDAPNQPVVQVFGETGDVVGLASDLEDRGQEATVIDESYGRSLRVTQPDDQQLYINETMDDLYGYHRLNA
ncbi:VOC family protein [Nesterenkonia ebinurensis]|uniref:VOC family protein n=1 Tax=Nesterenkonia ebinurensis TaxID=2608252 RepID=UPI00168AD768|nr:VOC family protein [Nesterenkonia ebinurensis]